MIYCVEKKSCYIVRQGKAKRTAPFKIRTNFKIWKFAKNLLAMLQKWLIKKWVPGDQMDWWKLFNVRPNLVRAGLWPELCKIQSVPFTMSLVTFSHVNKRLLVPQNGGNKVFILNQSTLSHPMIYHTCLSSHRPYQARNRYSVVIYAR